MSDSTLTITEIMNLIPHRYPMLLVDRIENIVIGQSCKGIKNVSINEEFFQGHFPKEPIMPGVLIVEAMAQTAGALVCHSLGELQSDFSVYFMSMNDVKFRKPVLPGDVLEMYVEKVQNRNKVWKFSGKAKVNNVLHAEAQFTAMVVDNTN